MNLFAYGTLRLPEVMERVTGETFAGEPATLPGFTCLRLAGRSYPGILARPGAVTEGMLYRGIGPDAMARLDRFEDDLYERATVGVRTIRRERVEATAYVVPPRAEHLLAPEPWSLDRFARDDLAVFLASIEDRMTGD